MKREQLADLAAFAAVAQESSFTRAAARLGITQSSLSHALRRLEASLGLRLLVRTTRSVAPTAAGERLLRALGPALEGIDTALASLSELRARPAGTIRISSGSHAAQTILLPTLGRLLPENPDIEVEITVDNAMIDVVAERYDAGVRFGEHVAKDMVAVCIGPPMRMAAVAAPSYFTGREAPRTPQDLAEHLCINFRLPTAGGLYVWEFEKAGRKVNARVEGQTVFNEVWMCAAAARLGLGVAFVPEDLVREDIEAGRLVRVLSDWCEPFSGYHLYYPSRRQLTPAFALLIEALRYRGARP